MAMKTKKPHKTAVLTCKESIIGVQYWVQYLCIHRSIPTGNNAAMTSLHWFLSGAIWCLSACQVLFCKIIQTHPAPGGLPSSVSVYLVVFILWQLLGYDPVPFGEHGLAILVLSAGFPLFWLPVFDVSQNVWDVPGPKYIADFPEEFAKENF